MKNPRPVFFIVLILITIASLVGVVTAQTHVCTSAEEKQSLREADTLRNWESLYKSYKLYKQCDDGAIAEGYSESVARILVDHWSRLDRLAAIAKTDVAFERFMMKHVDATLDIKDIEKIRRNAATRCPEGLGTLCSDIKKLADRALKDASTAK